MEISYPRLGKTKSDVNNMHQNANSLNKWRIVDVLELNQIWNLEDELHKTGAPARAKVLPT